MDKGYSPKGSNKAPESRYAYYRRCQVFRRNGEQCKAPAEKGAVICYAHAREQATEFRRKLDLTILLAEVVRRMRARGKRDFETVDIFLDFNAIQITLAAMAQALIDGRIDCKTAGRLAIGLQTAARLLRLVHRSQRGTQKKESLTTKATKEHEARPEFSGAGEYENGNYRQMNNREIAEIVLMRACFGFDRSHAPPEWVRAA
jgi:hypothetical protein